MTEEIAREPLIQTILDKKIIAIVRGVYGEECLKLAMKTSLKNVGDNMDGDTHVWSIPLYAFFKIKEYLAHEMGWQEK